MKANLIKLFLLCLFALTVTTVKAQEVSKEEVPMISPENAIHKKEGKADGVQQKDGILYGKDAIKNENVIAISDVVANPEKYKGQEVTLKGTVADVCQKAGCWMVLTDGKNDIRIFTNHEFFLPINSYDKNVILTGKFDIANVSEEDAKHYATESDRARVKPEDIKGPQKWMTVDAAGIKILTDGKDGNGGGEKERPKKHSGKKHHKKCGKDCCKKK